MSVTVKHKDGKADGTVTPAGTQYFRMFGPPASGNRFQTGVYEIQSGTSTYRHIEDLNTPGTASPASYTYAT